MNPRRQRNVLAGTILGRGHEDLEDGDMPVRFRNHNMRGEWGDLILDVAPAPGWMKDALCADPAYADVEFFGQTVRAKAICSRCSVWSECLEDALQHETDGNSYGVRGGLSASEREAIHAAEVVERITHIEWVSERIAS